ncbi:hypothetical protein CHS0354_028260 [Potamilus streckersoni]|uniref:Uncharacterized protein n=1 Tax=Potamilus streckersoni TaxID=2493646 RepID=A0AAE0RTM7_9BIVA|nr:hypothetical protein CHS0354_028260 [Potamilus streckersoni]
MFHPVLRTEVKRLKERSAEMKQAHLCSIITCLLILATALEVTPRRRKVCALRNSQCMASSGSGTWCGRA